MRARGFTRWTRIGVARFSAVELLIALVLLFVITPFVEALRHGPVIEGALMTLMLIAAVLAVGGRRATLLLTVSLAVPAVAGRWLHHLRPDWVPLAVYLVAAMVFVGFVVVNLLRFVLLAPRVDSEVLCASISAYLLLGLLWALAYSLTADTDPDAFGFNTASRKMAGFEAFYFSFVTLSTVGYGDITPVSPVARMLAVMEAMTGLLYIAVLISRLVALYSAPAGQGQPEDT